MSPSVPAADSSAAAAGENVRAEHLERGDVRVCVHPASVSLSVTRSKQQNYICFKLVESTIHAE